MVRAAKIAGLGIACVLLMSAGAFASSTYFWLAARHDWGLKQGCYLDLEAHCP